MVEIPSHMVGLLISAAFWGSEGIPVCWGVVQEDGLRLRGLVPTPIPNLEVHDVELFLVNPREAVNFHRFW